MLGMNMNSGKKRYEFLHHIADAKFRAYGSTIEEVFENAALAMFNIMINTEKLGSEVRREIEIFSQDIEALLVDWLSELLYLFEVDAIVFNKFKVNIIEEEGFSLKAYVLGEAIDLSKHSFDTYVKGVTFHDLKIKQDDGFCVQVVVDV